MGGLGDQLSRKEKTMSKPVGIFKMQDNVTYEMCPHCMTEKKLKAVMEKQVCSTCGNAIKPCSLCDPDTTNCNKCPLGPDDQGVELYELKHKSKMFYNKDRVGACEGRGQTKCGNGKHIVLPKEEGQKQYLMCMACGSITHL